MQLRVISTTNIAEITSRKHAYHASPANKATKVYPKNDDLVLKNFSLANFRYHVQPHLIIVNYQRFHRNLTLF